MSTGQFLKNNAPWLAAGSVLTLLSSFGQTFFISVFAAEIQDAFSLSHGQWGSIYALGTTASAVVMIWAGGLSDLFRVRNIGSVVLALLALSCLFMATNPFVWALPLVIFCLRLSGQGMASHIAMVAMARWFVAARGKALSVATLGFAVGEAVLPIIFVSLMTMVDWRWLWVVAACISLAGIPVLIGLLGRERTPQSMATKNASLGMQQQHWTRMQALRHPLFWFMVPAILGPSAFSTAFFFHQVYFAQIKGWEHLTLVAMFPVYTGVSVGAMILSGWALDRVGTARLIPYFQLPLVAAFLCFALGNSVAMTLIGFVMLGLTAGSNSTLPAAFWAEFYGTKYIGSIKALAAAFMVLGSAIGPGLTGILIDQGVGLELQYIGVAVFFAFASLLVWIGVRRYSHSL